MVIRAQICRSNICPNRKCNQHTAHEKNTLHEAKCTNEFCFNSNSTIYINLVCGYIHSKMQTKHNRRREMFVNN